MDLPATYKIAKHIAKQNGLSEASIVNGNKEFILSEWQKVLDFTKGHSLYSNFAIQNLEKKWTGVVQSMSVTNTKKTNKPFNMNDIM